MYFSQDSWHIEWNPLHKPPTPSSLTRLLLLPFAPLAASSSSPPHPSLFNRAGAETRSKKRWDGGGGVWVGSCSGGGRLEKESESVAPTESAEGQWAEIGPLVRGYSLKMWSVSHWAGTVDDKGTPVLMKSSLLSYQSLRVWGLFVFVLNVYVKVCAPPRMSLCVANISGRVCQMSACVRVASSTSVYLIVSVPAVRACLQRVPVCPYVCRDPWITLPSSLRQGRPSAPHCTTLCHTNTHTDANAYPHLFMHTGIHASSDASTHTPTQVRARAHTQRRLQAQNLFR